MFDQALDNYCKALAINDKDSILNFSMAWALIGKNHGATLEKRAIT